MTTARVVVWSTPSRIMTRIAASASCSRRSAAESRAMARAPRESFGRGPGTSGRVNVPQGARRAPVPAAYRKAMPSPR
ncbi:hypothetical protein GCM10010282_14350 [Streptomyces roseolus]|nr:hypothetical protein GCM10010282_14350 [Streptomyces roseolus]